MQLLSLLKDPGAMHYLAAAASGDIATVKDHLSKNPHDVCD